MSRIRADKFVNNAANGAPELTYGAEVPVGYGITGAGGINITGVVTATSFSGDGSGLTGVANTAIINADQINVIGVVTATSGSFSENVSVGGTLTYEDVTNIDSVGIITARSGIRVGAGESIGSDGAAVVYYGDGGNLTNVGGVWVEIDKQTVTGSVGNVTVSLGANLGVTTSYSQFKVYYDVWLNGDGSMRLRSGYGFSGNHPTDNIKSSSNYYYSGLYNRAGDAALQTFRGEATTAAYVAGSNNKRHHWGEIIFFNTAGRIPTNGTAGWPSMSYRADGYSGGDTDSNMWSVAGHFDDGAQNPLSCFQIYADQNLVAGEVRTYGLSV